MQARQQEHLRQIHLLRILRRQHENLQCPKQWQQSDVRQRRIDRRRLPVLSATVRLRFGFGSKPQPNRVRFGERTACGSEFAVCGWEKG